jgi:uncharacterized membrane protein/nitrite reductase/ring-hydroxylating ferredoxin subunit
MQSKARFAGHPLHPMLIPFPFAFFTGALVADAVGTLNHWPDWWKTGYLLGCAGVALGLLAAIPGVIDFIYVVPPRSSGRKRAIKHAIVNVTGVVLFAIVAWTRSGNTEAAPGSALILAELAGVGLVSVGGWLGGTLVYRNQIGVEHRYANAGKWKEVTIEPDPGKALPVAEENELKVNQMKLVRAGDKRIVLARGEAGYTAFDDRCTHKGGSLAGGIMACGTVTCPWHGSQFDVGSGSVHSGPATAGISTYKVEVRDGKVHLTL